MVMQLQLNQRMAGLHGLLIACWFAMLGGLLAGSASRHQSHWAAMRPCSMAHSGTGQPDASAFQCFVCFMQTLLRMPKGQQAGNASPCFFGHDCGILPTARPNSQATGTRRQEQDRKCSPDRNSEPLHIHAISWGPKATYVASHLFACCHKCRYWKLLPRPRLPQQKGELRHYLTETVLPVLFQHGATVSVASS